MSDVPAPADPDSPATIAPGSSRGVILIALLLLINVVNFVDRQLPFILIEPIKRDLGLSDTQVGVMAGLSFAVVYSFAGLALARLADRWSPRGVLTIALAVWSLLSGASGLARNFVQLLLARAGVAASEAGSTPTAHALIAHSFPQSRRALVLAIFSLGVPIGSTLGLALGGWINDLTSWRVAFLVVGLPGLSLAVLAGLVLPDVRRATKAQEAAVGLGAGVRHLWALRSFRWMAAASSLFACGSYAINVFAPAFLIRVHGLNAAHAGLAVGLAFGVGGGVGTLGGGLLADSLGRRDPRWRQWVPALGQLLSAPTALGAWLIGDDLASVVLLALTYLFGLLYFAPSFAAAQSLVPPELRAFASAALLFCLTLVGSSAGPLVVGRVSDLLAPTLGTDALRYALSLMALTILGSAWCFHRAARALPDDLAKAELGA